jgi:hypothetical protein
MISFFRFVADLFQLVLRVCPNGRGSPDPDVPASLNFNCRLQLAMHRVLGDKTQSSASICRKPRFSRRIRENFPTRSALQHDFASGISQHMEQKEISNSHMRFPLTVHMPRVFVPRDHIRKTTRLLKFILSR